MKLPKIIKEFISKFTGVNQNPRLNPGTEGIVLFGADNIPSYKSLSHEDKKKVDEYVKNIKPENLEGIIKYGEEVGSKSSAFADMLVNLFMQISENADEASGAKFTNKTLEEKLELRLNALLAAKQLTVYRSALEDLSKEARLRTVALEKVKQDRKHRIIDAINIFAKSDIGRRKIEDEQLDAAIDRMRNSAQIAVNQIQTVANSKDSMEMMRRAIEVYKAIVPENDDRVPEIEKKLLEDKKAELLNMAKVVIPDKKFYNHPIENEKDEIEELARIQMELEIYAQEHEKELDAIKRRVDDIRKKLDEQGHCLNVFDDTASSYERTIKQKKDRWLQGIDTLITKYKVFDRRINEEDLKALYQIKFSLLTLDINARVTSPFNLENIPQEEQKWYESIIEDKIESIMSGENPELIRAFENRKHIAQRTIQGLLRDKTGYIPKNILQDPFRLKLLLAFDTKGGLQKTTLHRSYNEFTARLFKNLNDETYSWAEMIPLKTFFRIYGTNKYWNYKSGDVNHPLIRLYGKYKEIEESTEGRVPVPDGVIKINRFDIGWRYYSINHEYKHYEGIIKQLREQMGFRGTIPEFATLIRKITSQVNDKLSEEAHDGCEQFCNIYDEFGDNALSL